MTVPKGRALEQWYELTCTFPEVGEVMVRGSVDREALEHLASRFNHQLAQADCLGPWKVREAPSHPLLECGDG